MSNCIKEFFDYDLVKKCSKCGLISLKSNFYNDKTKNDGFHPKCKFCRKEYHVDNKYRLVNKQNFYNKENRDQIIENQKK